MLAATGYFLLFFTSTTVMSYVNRVEGRTATGAMWSAFHVHGMKLGKSWALLDQIQAGHI